MLALEDPRWSTLTHAYGSAKDVPGLLRRLTFETRPQNSYDSEPWFSLWSCLCHQDDVFDASYAALPHIVSIASTTKGPLDFSFFQLPAAIEVARKKGNGPLVPEYLTAAYSDGLLALADCVAGHICDPWDQATLLSAMAAQAVAKGHVNIAEAIMNLDDDLIQRLIELSFDN